MGYQAPQDFVLGGNRLHRTSVCFKMYTALSFFCGVLYPARLSSAGSDTPQDFVLRSIRPHCQIRPSGTRQKSFESLPFSLKGHFSKIVFMYKLYYPRHKGSMLKEIPIIKIFFCSAESDTPQNNFYIQITQRIRTRIRNCSRV